MHQTSFDWFCLGNDKILRTFHFVATQQYILWFDVQMGNSFGVQMLQGVQDLAHTELGLDLAERTVFVENGL